MKIDKELFNLGFSYELGCGLGLLSQFLPLSKNSKLNLKFKEELSSEYSNGFNLTNEMYKQYFQATKYSLTDINDFMNKSVFIGFNQGQSLAWEYLNNINERITQNLADIKANPQKINEYMFAPDGIQNDTDLIYFQCNFYNPYGNRINTNKDKNNENMLNISFGISPDQNTIDKYSKKGEFLNADNMAVFKITKGPRKGIHILVIDNNFSISNVVNINSIEKVFSTLEKEHYKNMKKSNFSFISTEYHSTYDVEIATEIIKYADTLHDSSLMKMIQAGSYSYSFVNFLRQYNKFLGEDIYITLIGLKDNDFSIMSIPTFKLEQNLSLEDLMEFYEKCSNNDEIQKDNQLKRLEDLNRGYKSWERIPAGELADKVRSKNAVLMKDKMIQSLKENTSINEEDIDKLDNLTGQLQYTVLNESLKDFVSTVNEVREEHGSKIVNSLENPQIPLLICNGSPGIGKTTSLRNTANAKNKFLLMYFSPRTALGDDIEEKFKVDEDNKYTGILQKDMICLTASSKDPESTDGKKDVVRYTAQKKPSFSDKIEYIDRQEKSLFTNNKKDMFKYDSSRDITCEKESKSGAYQRVCRAVDEILGKGEYNKVITTLTLQACKKNNSGKSTTVSHLKAAFPFIKEHPTTKANFVDEAEYKRFCNKTQNVYIMIDEITGSEEGKGLYSEIKRIVLTPLEKYYAMGKERILNFKVIVADASLVNSDVITSYMESKENIQTPKVYVTDASRDKLGVYTETIDLNLTKRLSIKADVVNANCYPAKQLNIRYKVLNMSRKIKEDEKDIKFHEEITACEDRIIVSECIKDIKRGVQSIIYIQHIRRLDNIISSLKKEAECNKISMKEGIDYIIISSNLDDKKRQKIIAYNNEQNEVSDENRSLKVILMTSSASRGISFKKAERLHCVVQDYNIEPALMEIIQYVYRPRGDDARDRYGIKSIDFYLRNITYFSSKDEKIINQSQSIVSIASLLLLLRGCILSRIYGYVDVNGHPISLVPLGGTGVNSVNISIYEDIKKAIKEIRSEITLSKDKLFKEVLEFLEKVFSASMIITKGLIFESGTNGDNIYKKFVKTMQKNLFNLLFFKEFKDFYYYNGIMIFPITESTTDRLHMLKSEILKYKDEGEIILKILEDKDVKDVIRKPLSFIASLMDFDVECDKVYSSYLTQKNDIENRFMAIPIQSFIYYGDIDNFIYEEEKKESFGNLIQNIIRSQANPYGTLPVIPKRYKKYPYVTFKSNDFLGKRKNMFNSEYVMTSTELNMMNLLFLGKKKK